ncbi:hypothetical protein [Oribacterium sp. P6A1]|uniref:hypothetical protein n=1 Tax=Oribacterium sp. P6A1 TaxID=1410612 RepID=UPI00055B6E5F|nr:hypothetical protein [Oribacterium sp. P6A1]
MRDKARTRPFLDRIAEEWEKYPDLRFGQFVMEAIPDKDKLWNCEESEFLRHLDAFSNKVTLK